ncbi:MAG: hypothetical protein OEZ22_05310 [Spirochaetia bacterium]|nr:hypothetical protein [Spirochaetia bacterium]
MDNKEKAELIRKGNAAFNEGNIALAAKLFNTTGYKDGLIRVGDYFYFDKHQPLMAYGYYRKANHKQMIDRLFDGFVFAIQCWMHEIDSEKSDKKLTEKQIKENKTDKDIKNIGSDYTVSDLPKNTNT